MIKLSKLLQDTDLPLHQIVHYLPILDVVGLEREYLSDISSMRRRENVKYSDIEDVKGTVTGSEASRVVKMNVATMEMAAVGDMVAMVEMEAPVAMEATGGMKADSQPDFLLVETVAMEEMAVAAEMAVAVVAMVGMEVMEEMADMVVVAVIGITVVVVEIVVANKVPRRKTTKDLYLLNYINLAHFSEL